MDKLRKIAAWVWRIKERMILAVMVGVLCFRVYQVVYPVDDERELKRIPRPPQSQLPADVPTPGAPPRIPYNHRDLGQKPDFKNRNPFQYSRASSQRDSGAADDETNEIQLLRIQETNGKLLANIRTPGKRSGWYEEGQPFEAYTLIRIDKETGCCEIYAENLGKTVKKCLPQR